MRIGVNTLFLIPGEVGGSQTYCVETLKAMAEQFPEDAYVVFTQVENDAFLRHAFESHANVTFHQIAIRAVRRGVRIFREQTELPLRVARQRLDVLWSPGYTAPVFCTIPQVVSILDMQYKRFPEDLSLMARITTDALIRLAVWRCNRLLTISQFSKTEIMRYLPISSDRVDVARLAVSPVFGEPAAATGRTACPVELEDGPFLLCVANTYPHKNVDGMIRAFGHLHQRIEHRLVLVGGARRGEVAVREALGDLPAAARDRVVRIARLDLAELVDLYQRCAAFVFPSLYEGFGLPILEAMLAGAPVVAADIPTVHEVGGAQVACCDTRDAQALAETVWDVLQRTPEQRQHQRQEGLTHARQFSWAETARMTRQSFERV